MLHWLRTVRWRDVLAELTAGSANMTAMEAINQHLNMERANDMKGGGVKYEGMA